MRNMNTYSKQNVYGKRIVYICPDGADPEAITRRYTLLSFLCIWSHLAFSASRSLFFCRANTKHSLPPSSCNQQTKQSVVQSGRPTKCGVVVVGSHTIHVLYYPIVLVSPYVFHIQWVSIVDLKWKRNAKSEYIYYICPDRPPCPDGADPEDKPAITTRSFNSGKAKPQMKKKRVSNAKSDCLFRAKCAWETYWCVILLYGKHMVCGAHHTESVEV